MSLFVSSPISVWVRVCHIISDGSGKTLYCTCNSWVTFFKIIELNNKKIVQNNKMAQNHVLGEEARECQCFRTIPGKKQNGKPHQFP